MKILVTGGAGYLGSVLCLMLLEQGHHVRVLDSFRYGARALLALLGHERLELVRVDIRDRASCEFALQKVDAVVHLAAIVGDPACAREPDAAREINETASFALIAAAHAAGVQRFVFASTCSNYGRMADTSVLATEQHPLSPLSLYAETKVAVEHMMLNSQFSTMAATVLRFATLYGLSPRMRFDLTINQFVMEMMVKRKLAVFGEQFWRPYVHVRDAARAIHTVLVSPPHLVAGQVFNVGHTEENYRKLDLIELIGRRVSGAEVELVSVAEDPRDYKVSFEHIRAALGFRTTKREPDGIDEIALAIEMRILDHLSDVAYSNVGHPVQAPTRMSSVEDLCAQ